MCIRDRAKRNKEDASEKIAAMQKVSAAIKEIDAELAAIDEKLNAIVVTPVSYTHLEVYKRQTLDFVEPHFHQGCA